MVRFLSDAWFDEVERALGTGGNGAAVDLTIQQVVTNAPEGEVRYYVELRGGRMAVRRGDAERPDATFTEDYGTATAVASGKLSPQDALLAGRIRIAGNLSLLLEHRSGLAALDAVPADLRNATTY